MTKVKINTELLMQWDDAKAKLAHYKELEMKLRKQVVAEHYPESKKGVNNLDLKKNHVLKYTKTIKTKLDIAAFEAMKENLSEGVVDRIVEYKPSLVASEMEHLKLKDKRLMNSVLSTYEAAPSLVIVKKKK